jgi:hypothetical protein
MEAIGEDMDNAIAAAIDHIKARYPKLTVSES